MTPEERVVQLEGHLRQISGGQLPACPTCGSEDGVLGTTNAYFVCRQCAHEQYWGEGTWTEKVMASPWGRPSYLAAELHRLGKERAAQEGQADG